ncbi:MAG: hypothetical protein C5B59_14355 [Bacteroidetes bacterium]|nr:MAG: hypothetical protein C5B59_14355 [Bacteroidota bacterium]
MTKIELMLFRLRKKLKGKLKREMVYPTYEKALKFCSMKGYENDDIINTVKIKTTNYRKALRTAEYPIINVGIMPILQAIHKLGIYHRRIVVFDFGGADGIYYLQSRKCLKHDIELLWCVVETAEMANAMKEFETDELKFFDSLSKAIEFCGHGPDIFHTSSTIQYTLDPLYFLKQICNSEARYLVFNRQSLNRNNYSLITTQTSLLSWHGQGSLPANFDDKIVMYPHTNLSQTLFEEVLTEKYLIEFAYEDLSGVKNVNKEPIVGLCYFCELKS